MAHSPLVNSGSGSRPFAGSERYFVSAFRTAGGTFQNKILNRVAPTHPHPRHYIRVFCFDFFPVHAPKWTWHKDLGRNTFREEKETICTQRVITVSPNIKVLEGRKWNEVLVPRPFGLGARAPFCVPAPLPFPAAPRPLSLTSSSLVSSPLPRPAARLLARGLSPHWISSGGSSRGLGVSFFTLPGFPAKGRDFDLPFGVCVSFFFSSGGAGDFQLNHPRATCEVKMSPDDGLWPTRPS